VTGWGSTQTLALIGSGMLMLLVFVGIEGRLAKAPLMPLRLFRSRSLSVANVIMLIVGGSTFAMWFFFSLYLQEVLGFSPIKAGLTFLPMTLAIVVGATVASRITIRVGPKRLLIAGMLCLSAGLLLFTQLSTAGGYIDEMLAPGLLTAVGMSFAFIPATICATSGVANREAGLASGVVNTARLFGGALGLAILAAIATARTDHLLHPPTAGVHAVDQALLSGFQLAFAFAAGFAFLGAVIAAFGMPSVSVRVQVPQTQVQPAADA
jgi:predicted MFS family arabinose efflux permease